MDAYDRYTYATKRMDEINDCISFHRQEISKLEETYLNYKADATEAYNELEKAGELYQSFYEKTNIE